MKEATHNQYFSLIEKVRSNAYLYVSLCEDAKQNLIPSEFKLLQEQLTLN